MGFSVNDTALTGLIDLLDRRWDDFESGRRYLAEHTRLSVTRAGVLNAIFGSHQQIVLEIDRFLAAAAEDQSGRFATALAQALDSYRHTDLATARHVDAALPRNDPAGSGEQVDRVADPGLGRSVFADPTTPAHRYLPPPDHRADYPHRFVFFDTFSPTSWARELIWRVTAAAAAMGLLDRPYDVVEEAVEPLCGDWAGYLGCADVYDNLALAVDDVAGCLDVGVAALPRVWTGNAAGSCAIGLDRLAADLRTAVDPLHQTATAYRRTAEQVRAQAEAVAAALTLLLDEIVESGLDPVSGNLVAPLRAATGAGDLTTLAGRVAEVGRLVAKAYETATAGMSGATTLIHMLGVITDDHPVPALVPAVPIGPVRAARRPE